MLELMFWLIVNFVFCFCFAASSRLKTLIIIGCVVASIVGLVLIAVLINCVVTRCPLHKTSERQHNAERAPDEPMLPSEHAVIYRPGKHSHVKVLNDNASRRGGGPADPAASDNRELEPLSPDPTDDTRPISLPPTYDEVMSRVSRVDV